MRRRISRHDDVRPDRSQEDGADLPSLVEPMDIVGRVPFGLH